MDTRILLAAMTSSGLLGALAVATANNNTAQERGGIQRKPAESESGRKMTSAKGSVLAGSSNRNTSEQEQWNEEIRAKKESRKAARTA